MNKNVVVIKGNRNSQMTYIGRIAKLEVSFLVCYLFGKGDDNTRIEYYLNRLKEFDAPITLLILPFASSPYKLDVKHRCLYVSSTEAGHLLGQLVDEKVAEKKEK